jgi:chromosome segregation protein
MPRPALADALADGNAEQLRTSNIRLLEQLQAAKRENAELERRLNAQPQVQVHARMKPEELDALYVEEQRQIEALTREVGQLRAQAAGGRAHRDASVAAAQDEVKRLTKQVEDLKETMRRQAQMAVAQLDQVRGAYAKELEERADECEAGRVQLSAMALELALSSAEKEKALRQLSAVERRAAEAEALMSGSANDIARRATDAAASANAAIAAATARAHAAEEQRDAARKEARRAEGAVEQLQKEISEISEARAMRDASFAALGEAQEHVKAIEAKRQMLEAELKTTRLTIKRLEAAAAEVAESHRVLMTTDGH